MTGKYAKFDTSEAATLSADFGDAPARIAKNVTAALFRSAQEVKKAMRADALSSKHFKGIASSIDFDVTDNEFAGVGVLRAEIGPHKGSGEPGNLGNIAYFGNSRGAGGTLRDPDEFAEDEAPTFERYMEAAAIRMLG